VLRHLPIALTVAALVLGTQGCAALGLMVVSTGASVAAGTGTGYTLDSIAYRTFALPIDEIKRSTLRALKYMDVEVKSDAPMEDNSGRKIVAQAADRTIHIDLERLTTRTTRMRVTAKQGWFFRDRATAAEIISQTERVIEETPAVSQRSR
jgi:hypothetical protein